MFTPNEILFPSLTSQNCLKSLCQYYESCAYNGIKAKKKAEKFGICIVLGEVQCGDADCRKSSYTKLKI